MQFFCAVSTSRQNVKLSQMKFYVPAVPAMLHGIWENGDVWKPDIDAIKAALPKRWHKAFERGPVHLWFHSPSGQFRVELTNAKNQTIAHIYCNATQDKESE